MGKKPHNVNLLTLDELDSKELNNIIDLAINFNLFAALKNSKSIFIRDLITMPS